MTIKPHNPTISINGDVYVKQPDRDHLICSIYRNEEKQREVKVEWSNFFGCWYLQFIGGEKAFYELDEPIFVDEKIIYTYLTADQNESLNRAITQVLLNVSK